MSADLSLTGRKPPREASPLAWAAATVAAIALWFVVYAQLALFSQWLVARLPVEPGSHLAEAVAFFIYDTPKVLMLLTLVVFAMGVVRSFFSAERTRALLAGKREGLGN
ncbi:permease, partial [Xanthobacter autotrophicus ATCC 700551]